METKYVQESKITLHKQHDVNLSVCLTSYLHTIRKTWKSLREL